MTILLPAFITSGLKTAFQIGFLLFLPFLVIDMVIASVLMSLGMMMLARCWSLLAVQAVVVCLVDGWAMTVGSLCGNLLCLAGVSQDAVGIQRRFRDV